MRSTPSGPPQCRACGQIIRVVTMPASGRAMPVNPLSDPDGDLLIWDAGGGRWIGVVITPDTENDAQITLASNPRSRRVTAHWATCPDYRPTPPTGPAPEPTLF